ncbi:MAG: flagellar basal-body rod protein FlgF [Thermoproteota archaeon]
MKNIWVPLSGQIAQMRKVETIANNIANANTPGFKKDDIVFKEHLTALSKGVEDIDMPNKEWAPKDFYRSQGAENAQVKVDEVYTNFKQGALSPTGNKMDLGLNGKGFLEVLTPNGVRFTRKGIFNLSKDGELVTTEGFRVLSSLQVPTAQGRALAASIPAPESRIIKLQNDKNFAVTLTGDIFNGNQNVGKISIVEFKDATLLKKEGNQLFIGNDIENQNRQNVKTSVHQGFIEESNVNALSEMSELIQAHRQFENIQRAIKTYDAISGKTVNDIARF